MKKVYYKIMDAHHEMYYPLEFSTAEEAEETIQKEYKNRSKNDGYDDFWKNREQKIIKFTEEIL